MKEPHPDRIRVFWSTLGLILLVLCLLIGVKLFKTRLFSKDDGEKQARLKYLDKLDVPSISQEEILENLHDAGYVATKQEYDAVNWYVKQGNRQIIRQLVDNLRREVEKIKLYPDETEEGKKFYKFKPYDSNNRISVDMKDLWGKISSDQPSGQVKVQQPKSGFRTFCSIKWRTPYHSILSLYFGDSDGIIGEILQEKISEVSKGDEDPHLVYLTMKTIAEKQRAGCTWFTAEEEFLRAVKSYLGIYANYEEWPSIRQNVDKWFWRNSNKHHAGKLVDEVLKATDEQGVDFAYAEYCEKFKLLKATKSISGP